VRNWLQHTEVEGDCLVWTRCFNSDGYPRAGVAGNVNLKVHREVFFSVNGYYPPVVRHTCDNRRCINPDHLIGGTNLDNIQDRHTRGRDHNHVTEEERLSCIALRQQGMTYGKIGTELSMKRKRVEYILARRRKES
jgi:hypothetical protein